MKSFTSFLILFIASLSYPICSNALGSEDANEGMNNHKLEEIIQRLDGNFQGKPGYWQFKIAQLTVSVITDESNNRMRIIVPITKTEELSQDHLYRLMQANFDSSLDARYAIAKDILWSSYIHPLSSLDDAEFLSGLGQTVNLASTFGTTYSSGLLSFGGGDSDAINRRKLIEELIEKGQAI